MNEGKAPWASKTFWANGIAMVTMLVGYYASPELAAQISGLDATLILTVINIILRLVSKKPISIS